MSEPKVTECWTIPQEDFSPGRNVDYIKWTSRADAAILLWREDYAAMRKELEELREQSEEWQRFKELNRNMWLMFKKSIHDDEEAK